MRNNHIKGTVIVLKEGEDVNRALRRFKNKIEDLGTLKFYNQKSFTKSQLLSVSVRNRRLRLVGENS